MNYGFGFHAVSNLRLSVTRRGPRVSIGPRIATIRGGGERAGRSAEAGSWSAWSQLAGGGRATPSTTTQRGEVDVWQGQRSHLDALLARHEATVVHATPPEVPQAEPVDAKDVRRDLRRSATDDIPLVRMRSWLSARRAAERTADAEVARRQQQQDVTHQDRQQAANAWWGQLLDNDEVVVLDQLQRAFERDELPATPVAVTDATIHLVVSADTPDRLIGKREPTLEDDGTHTMAIMSKPHRHELYVQAICSAILAVATESFAVAPGLDDAEVAVVAPGHPAGPAVIALCALSRDVVLPDGAERAAIDDLPLAAERGQVRLVMERYGQARAPRPLPPEDPSVERLLDILEVEG